MERKCSCPKEKDKGNSDFRALPIHRYRKKLVQAVRDNSFLIVTGETGSGKTTQLPQYLFKDGFAKHGVIGVTQPRRVATLSVAQRVAEEMNSSLGSTVGYQVRFDDCTSEGTAIKYMTDGCLLRQILADLHLTKYSVIILDEAHERSLSTDILFGLLKRLFQQKKPPKRRKALKVVVMSATLEVDKLSEFFGGCAVVDIPGRNYPVKEIFCALLGPKDTESSTYVTEAVKVTLDIHLNESAGDILVFLTGQSEIERTCDLLFQKAESVDYRYDVQDCSVEGLLILPLYGSMPTEMEFDFCATLTLLDGIFLLDQQRRIFLPSPPGIRKCVVATNVAATSLTIDGIRYVVDSGFVKQLNHNPRVGLDILEVVPISKSEAMQRAGRAGRTSSGKCYRVYSKEFWDQCMPDHMIPEIKRTSLTSVILTLKCLAVHDVIRFPYLDRPEERHILEALKQLYQCDAIDRRGHVTRLGEFLVQFPLPPNLTCAVIKAASLDCEDLLLPIAAMLSVENVFIRPAELQKQKEAELRHQELSLQAGGCNDFATLLNIFEQCKSSCQTSQESVLMVPEMKYSEDVCARVLRQCSQKLHDQEPQPEWIIFHDVLVTSKIYVRTVCPIRYEWVKDLLPKLHEIDVYELSSVAREEVTEEEITKWQNKEDLKRQSARLTDDSAKMMEKRNDDKSIQDARLRYLQRKQQRAQCITAMPKEMD